MSRLDPLSGLPPRTDLFQTDVLPLFEKHRGGWLAQARAVALRIARQQGTVTIDDVRERCPPPADIDPRVMGAVFRTSAFEATGKHVKSGRRECHNRPVAVFRLANKNYPEVPFSG